MAIKLHYRFGILTSHMANRLFPLKLPVAASLYNDTNDLAFQINSATANILQEKDENVAFVNRRCFGKLCWIIPALSLSLSLSPMAAHSIFTFSYHWKCNLVSPMLSVNPYTPAHFLLLQLAPFRSHRGRNITQPRLYLGPPMFKRPSNFRHRRKVNPVLLYKARLHAKEEKKKKEAGAWQKKQCIEQSAGVTQSTEHPKVIMLRFIIKHHKPAALVIILVQFTDITSHHFWVMRMKIF